MNERKEEGIQITMVKSDNLKMEKILEEFLSIKPIEAKVEYVGVADIEKMHAIAFKKSMDAVFYNNFNLETLEEKNYSPPPGRTMKQHNLIMSMNKKPKGFK